MKKIYLFFLLFACMSALSAQQRYIDPIFTDVNVEANVVYGVNATVIAVSVAGQAIPQPLVMDVYTPDGDTEVDRPLVIMLHTGNFLPPSVNGGCSGTHKDADVVNAATELAKRGYVVASADYRLGWNPVSPDPTTRVFTLINAVYRGIQDSKTCIRFFRKSIDSGDPYGIDDTKITLWGFGTGGYIALAAATVDTITDSYIPKFLTPLGPMVIEPINGNVEGTTVGITVPGYPGFPVGDTLCYPNHVGYASDFALTVNLGGALGDTSWLDANDPPLISYQVPTDPFAPCAIGTVLVPPPVNLPVVEVMGACTFQAMANALGVNDAYASVEYIDAISDIAKSRNGDIEGFFPFPSSDPTEGSPWNYASSLEPYGVVGSNCDTGSVSAHVYLDTILQYFLPRACVALGLGCDLTGIVSAEEILVSQEVGFVMAPNPSYGEVALQSREDRPMLDIQVYDLNGRLVRSVANVSQSAYTLQRGQLPPGMYVVKVRFEEGFVAQRLVLN